MFLGFVLAVISIQGFLVNAVVSFGIPFLVLGLPIADTAFAILRRLLRGQHPFHADRKHLPSQASRYGTEPETISFSFVCDLRASRNFRGSFAERIYRCHPCIGTFFCCRFYQLMVLKESISMRSRKRKRKNRKKREKMRRSRRAARVFFLPSVCLTVQCMV